MQEIVGKHCLRWAFVMLLSMGLLSCQSFQADTPYHPGPQPTITIIPPHNPYASVEGDVLIGGPQAEGRVGDTLLSNGIIQVVIQQPGKYPGVGSFGGNIIDADWVRADGVGRDQFGKMLPLINIEWTLNAKDIMAFKEFNLPAYLRGELQPLDARDASVKTPVIVVRSTIDVYDFLDVDFLEPIAKTSAGQPLSYDARFDDMNAPFQSTDLKNLNINAYTEYRIPPGQRYVEITTTLINEGNEPVKLPVGDFVNGSGELQLLIPGMGYAPELVTQILGDTPAVIYTGLPGIDVSYGYFYQLDQFVDVGDGEYSRRETGSLSYSGVTGVLLGESFPKIFPLGSRTDRATINFEVPADGMRSFTRYLVVGDGSAGSVMDAGMHILGLSTRTISGHVLDQQGQAVSGAQVAIIDDEETVVTYRSDAQGRFSGYLSDGTNTLAQAFGSGKYTVRVEKPGYAMPETEFAGTCTPDAINAQLEGPIEVTCVLGLGGVIALQGPLHDADTGSPMVGRLTILGADPSPDRERPGMFRDTDVAWQGHGIVATYYINKAGGFDLSRTTTKRLEPGRYIFVYSRGPEYEVRREIVTVDGYGTTPITPGTLRRVMPTPNFISADFHVHANPSPDSPVSVYHRALGAAGEGLDVIHSSDHDYLFDYAPVVADLERDGLLGVGTLGTIVGDEVSPNHMGHIHAFPLDADPTKVHGGALNWSWSPLDRDDPSPDYAFTVPEIIDALYEQAGEHELVVQMNHISDVATGMPSISGLVTSPVYRSEGVPLMSVFSDPMMTRMPFDAGQDLPIPFGVSPHTSNKFTAIELTIGSELSEQLFWETGLPQWFNFLNAGQLYTATGDSDSHVVGMPLGMPRNFIMSPVDPADGMGGSMYGVDRDEYARAINEHKVIVSAGPMVYISAENEHGEYAELGDTITGNDVNVRVVVEAPSWAWFDTIEIFANTEPIPLDDDGVGVVTGTAAHAHSFYEPYHRPWFLYDPTASYRLRDGTLTSWAEEDGVIRAEVELSLNVDEDTWVMAIARGSAGTEGFRSPFPVITNNYGDAHETIELPERFTYEDYETNTQFTVPAWGFTNPIFIDTDGDTNGDGVRFEGMHQL